MTEVGLKIKKAIPFFISNRILTKLEVIYNHLLDNGLSDEIIIKHLVEITVILRDEYAE